jgi:hypothetical protein
MDQDLRSRIKAAAQERGLDPDTLLNFAHAESTLNPNAKAKTSSAHGLFQVINKTWKEHGGRDRSNVDEQIRVGADVIASNQASFKRKFNREPSAAELYAYHVLGPTGAPPLLKADPATPMEQIVSREAIKANPNWQGKTAGDVLGTYEKKVGGSQKAPVASNQPNTRMKGTNFSFQPLTQLDIDNLGPGYQAAMAAMALGDTQGDDEDNIAERAQEAQDDAQNSMLADSGSRNISGLDMQYQSPFPQEAAPVQLAKGGEARKMMDAVYRADGSPEYGEISMGDFSDPNAGRDIMKNVKMPTKEDAKYLSRIPKEGVSNTESFIRGSLAAIPGSVGDIEAAFRNPRADSQAFPTKSGVEARKETVFPTTERILESVPRITPANERSAGFEDIGTYDMGVAAAPVGKVLAKGAKVAAPVVAEAMANSTVPKLLKPALQPELLEPMNIMTPSGRVFLANKTAAEEPISNLDKGIKGAIEWTNLVDNPDAKPAVQFMDKKVREYFKNRAGTVNDEVREGLITGRIKIPKNSPLEEEFPQALIDAARKGDVTAMKVLENKLHKDMDIGSTIKSKDYTTGREAERAASENTRLAILEQMKNNPNVIPDSMLLRLAGKDVATMPTKEAAAKVAEIRAKLKENPNLFNTVYEAKIARLIPEDTVKSVAEESLSSYANLYPALNNASKKQEGIMALQQNAPITDISSRPTILGLSLRQLMAGAQDIPAKELERMSVPDVINRALQTQVKANQSAELAKKAERLVSAGKPVPEEISTFGTKEFLPKDQQGFVWREVTDPHATKIHSALMDNSIKGYSERGTYGSINKGMSGVQSGEVKLYGLYDPQGQLVTNVEYITPKATGETGVKRRNTITQFYGNGPRTGNVEPSNYVPQVESLVRQLNPDDIPYSIKQLFKDNQISFDK